ncbi:MAG: leucine-rich repeat domain-containing protein, partial [Lachnospiraceae bacterium]|nr:leucine-rich repeat domain-containing protein [Lachnospiraceae bacterium]
IQLTADHEKNAWRNDVISMVGVCGDAFIESGTVKIDASADELSGVGIGNGNIVLGINDGIMDRTTPCIDVGSMEPLRCGNHLIMYDGSITGCSEKQYEPEELEEGYAICNVDLPVNSEKGYWNEDWGERLSYSQYVYNNSFLAKEDTDKKYNAIYDWKEWDETGKDKIPYTCKVKLTDPDDKDITFTHMCEVDAVETQEATCVQPRLVTYTARYGEYTDELKKDYGKDKRNHIHTEVREARLPNRYGGYYINNTYCLDCGELVKYGQFMYDEDPGDDKSDTSEYPNPVIKPGVTVPATTTQAPIVSTGTVVVKGVGTEIKVPGTNGTFKVTNASATFEVVYVAPDNKTVAGIAIPETIASDGVTYKVTSIAPNAFKGCKKLKKVTIPAGITSIGAKAFYGCKNLKNITVKSTSLNKIGKKAFAKIHAKAKVKVPKAKKAAYKKLFKKAGLSGKGQKIK